MSCAKNVESKLPPALCCAVARRTENTWQIVRPRARRSSNELGNQHCEKLVRKTDVDILKFDFCRLGMRAKDDKDKEHRVLNPTKVMTISQHVSVLLMKARCEGEHEHIRLEHDRAKSCEVHPDIFCDAICRASSKS